MKNKKLKLNKSDESIKKTQKIERNPEIQPGGVISEIKNHILDLLAGKSRECRQFKHEDKFILNVCAGIHRITVDPKLKIKQAKVRELEEFSGIPVCCPQNNIIDVTVNDDKIILDLIIRTNIACLEISIIT